MFKIEPITALFDTETTCSCNSKQVFHYIVDKINLIRKPLKVNATSRATLGPVGIAPLDLNIEEQNFTHYFIGCTKLKQNLILGLHFAQRYKICIDWDINRKLFLRCKGKKIPTYLKTNDSGQQAVHLLKFQ